MPAAGQAEVVARDLHPLVVLRRLQHPLQQLVVAGFELLALPQGPTGVLDPRRERVANRLQLAQVEHPRLARARRHVSGHLQAAKSLGHQSRQLSFEAPDLAPQLDPGEPLVPLDPQRKPAVSL